MKLFSLVLWFFNLLTPDDDEESMACAVASPLNCVAVCLSGPGDSDSGNTVHQK